MKVQTEGMMRVGWATPSFPAHLSLGDDEHSYAFDGYLVHCIMLPLTTNYAHVTWTGTVVHVYLQGKSNASIHAKHSIIML